jgi:hypothetical protein
VDLTKVSLCPQETLNRLSSGLRVLDMSMLETLLLRPALLFLEAVSADSREARFAVCTTLSLMSSMVISLLTLSESVSEPVCMASLADGLLEVLFPG